ncbi:MAG: succinate dehydrogenase cytochrome b subunit [candidate division Zixibacteria bacterium]|nr:succinate dehydrogenase cytochrome b subunit [candidate division Zixibacteria bacterium]MDH3936308.1 succinate dehydrogenase cytochrome b subunit [candidate division Zixibacteria bacterium]MDH4032883.1 succinate dehydrogenase cytochrome b subunit [candidate division Zixibacteria bacterium]
MTTAAKTPVSQSVRGSGYSSIGKKIWMAVTGVTFIGFVAGHLIGNLQIFLGQEKLNAYALFLHDLGKLLWIVRGTMALFLVIHVWTGVRLYLQNKSARPISYRRMDPVETGLTSRTMIWSGLGIFLYLLYHLLHFTFITTNPEYASLTDAAGRFDVYSMVILGFQNYLISIVYLVAMFALAFHINHALPSLLQTFGLTRPSCRTCLKRVGNIAAILFFVGYASMPVAVLLNLISLPGGH